MSDYRYLYGMQKSAADETRDAIREYFRMCKTAAGPYGRAGKAKGQEIGGAIGEKVGGVADWFRRKKQQAQMAGNRLVGGAANLADKGLTGGINLGRRARMLGNRAVGNIANAVDAGLTGAINVGQNVRDSVAAVKNYGKGVSAGVTHQQSGPGIGYATGKGHGEALRRLGQRASMAGNRLVGGAANLADRAMAGAQRGASGAGYLADRTYQGAKNLGNRVLDDYEEWRGQNGY